MFYVSDRVIHRAITHKTHISHFIYIVIHLIKTFWNAAITANISEKHFSFAMAKMSGVLYQVFYCFQKGHPVPVSYLALPVSVTQPQTDTRPNVCLKRSCYETYEIILLQKKRSKLKREERERPLSKLSRKSEKSHRDKSDGRRWLCKKYYMDFLTEQWTWFGFNVFSWLVSCGTPSVSHSVSHSLLVHNTISTYPLGSVSLAIFHLRLNVIVFKF